MAYAAAVIAAIGLAGQVMGGQSAKGEANFEANQLDQNAGQAEAASQRDAAEQLRQSRLAQSRAIAVAAASGGGASDPTVVNIVGNIAKRGQYNADMALYQGESRASYLRSAAQAKRFEGSSSAFGADLKGGGDFLSSMYQGYGS